MTASADLHTVLTKLKDLAETWVPGDLMGLAQLRSVLETLTESSAFTLLPPSWSRVLKDLSVSIMDLLEEGNQGPWFEKFRALGWQDLLLAPEEEVPAPPEEPAAPSVDSEPEPALPNSPMYPEGYFDHIIEDTKLLTQLCDEVREHLDQAQFSLVDLERDPGDGETVNRVFRSFHTLKSSAAFLGLKNIEEVAHVLEELLVLVRDGKMVMSSDLTDVIFQGIGLLRDLEQIIETSEFRLPVIVEAFKSIDIYKYIRQLRHILDNYSHKKIGQLMVEKGILSHDEVEHILDTQKETSKLFGEIAVESKLASTDHVQGAVQKQAARKVTYVKVLNDRLNALVDIVGELVVNQSMIRQYLLDPEGQRESAERTVNQLENITTGIKNLVLSMGMVSIAEVFNKLRVVVRNTANETGRLVTVDFQGEDTELDRNVIETIYDPLVHLVRNAIDHGLEVPADREAAGKKTVGLLRIQAEHKGSGIELTIEDDGRGIDRSKVLEKALRIGAVTEAQAAGMKDREILDLLFRPGFSTKDVATEISGRGVGLDVVKQNIDQLHGRVDVESVLGQGTRFTVRIPLTLAIIEGFVTEVEKTKYIFPFNLIEEIIVPEEENLRRMDDGSCLIYSRGHHVPVIQAGKIFGHKNAFPADSGQTGLVIVINTEEHRYGIAVDAVVGKQEIVIKSLNEALKNLKVFSGGTIFGNGEIGFVVDVEEFIREARKAGNEDTDR